MNRRAFLGAALGGCAVLALAPSIALAQGGPIVIEMTEVRPGVFSPVHRNQLPSARLTILEEANRRALLTQQAQSMNGRATNGLFSRIMRNVLKPTGGPAGLVRNLVTGGLMLGMTWALSNGTAIQGVTGGIQQTFPGTTAPTSSFPLQPASVANITNGVYRTSNGALVAWSVRVGVTQGGTLPAAAGWNWHSQVTIRALDAGGIVVRAWFSRQLRASFEGGVPVQPFAFPEVPADSPAEAFDQVPLSETIPADIAARIPEALVKAPGDVIAESDIVADPGAISQVAGSPQAISIGSTSFNQLAAPLSSEAQSLFGVNEAQAPVVQLPESVAPTDPNPSPSPSPSPTAPPTVGLAPGDPVEPGEVGELPTFDAFVNPFRNLFDPFAGVFEAGSPSCPSFNMASVQFGPFGSVGGQSFTYHCQVIEPFRPVIVAASAALGGWAAVSHILEA